MKYLLSFLLLSASYSHAAMSTAGQESEHFRAEFWQRPDGKYCVKIIQFDEQEELLKNHIYVFEHLMHSEECPCDLKELIRSK